MNIYEKQALVQWDIIETVWKNSFAVIEWGDGSITRLWGNSKIKIDNVDIKNDLSTIQVAFRLLTGKTQSHVISYMWENSYFIESFQDSQAAVRGTTFQLDLDNNYLYVSKHKLAVTKNDGEEFIIKQFEPLSLINFELISLEEFIRDVRDTAFTQWNNLRDIEYFDILQKNIESSLKNLKDISNLDIQNWSSEKKEKWFRQVKESYQKLHIIWGDSPELFAKKLEYKSALLNLAPNITEKKLLFESTLEDLRDTIHSKHTQSITDVLSTLKPHIEEVWTFNINDYIDKESLSDDLKIQLKKHIDFFESIFDNDVEDFFSQTSQTVNNIGKKANRAVHDVLNTLINK